MESTHAGRADELANEANRMLLEALAADGDPGAQTDSLFDNIQQRRWERLRAVQAQAQIHATLALNDAMRAR